MGKCRMREEVERRSSGGGGGTQQVDADGLAIGGAVGYGEEAFNSCWQGRTVPVSLASTPLDADPAVLVH